MSPTCISTSSPGAILLLKMPQWDSAHWNRWGKCRGLDSRKRGERRSVRCWWHGWDERPSVTPAPCMMTGRCHQIGWGCVVNSHWREPFICHKIRQFCQVERSGGKIGLIIVSHIWIHIELPWAVGEQTCVGWIRAGNCLSHRKRERDLATETHIYRPYVCWCELWGWWACGTVSCNKNTNVSFPPI